MDCKTYKIGKRITLSHIKTDKFKKARLTATFNLPNNLESSPLYSMLVSTAFLGTEKHQSFREICLQAEELYSADISDINIRIGNRHIFGVYASFLNDSYITAEDKSNGFSVINGVFELISQIILYPLFRKSDTETEKANQIKRIRSRQNDAFGYAKYRFTRLMFEKEPCGYPLLGEVSDVENITPEDLRRALDFVLNNAPLEFFYCGSESAEKIIGVIRSNFDSVLDGESHIEAEESVLTGAKETREIVESGEYRQGNFLLGFRTGTTVSNPEFYATEMMNQIYGDGPVSKLFQNVREKKSLCYFCASNYDEVRGVVVVGCGINNNDYEDAKAEVLHQLEEIRKGHISDSELAAAREAILSDCKAAEDHPANYESFDRIYRHYGGPQSIDEYKQGILRVSKEEIVAAAQRMSLDTVYFLRGTLEDGGYDEE